MTSPCMFCGMGLELGAVHTRAECEAYRQQQQRKPPPHAEPYTNPGKGFVLKSDGTTAKVAAAFERQPYWTSQELNDLVGWQFSQAIFALRRRGWKIVTLRIGPRAFAYERVSVSA